ncbi:MAG: 4Fe-4S dicluster domain-containing protein [bacterium]|nr:4Fe-4S dicluster domain-containing protein [bacterium]
MSSFRYLENVVTLDLNSSKCVGCKMCMEVCPHAVFKMERKKAVIKDKNACMECGACMLNCPVNALKVRSGVGCAAGIIASKIGLEIGGCDCRNSANANSCCSSDDTESDDNCCG